MEKNEKSILEKLGLTPHESAIYLALIDSGAATLTEIARSTGIHRALIYKAIPGLIERRLISVTPKGKRLKYVAESPEHLRESFENLSNQFGLLIPELEARQKAKAGKPTVKFFEGLKGMSTVLDDMVKVLKKGDIYYRYSSRKESTDIERILPASYRKLRDEKQLERYVITSERDKSKKHERLGRVIKTFPVASGPFDFNVGIFIYANKIAYLDYNSETALLIENQKIAEFQKKIFKLLFDRL
ncbi:MAG: helix-turn-helix domain-containing protein [bacterium]